MEVKSSNQTDINPQETLQKQGQRASSSNKKYKTYRSTNIKNLLKQGLTAAFMEVFALYIWKHLQLGGLRAWETKLSYSGPRMKLCTNRYLYVWIDYHTYHFFMNPRFLV